MDLQEVGCGDMDWIDLGQLAGTCECGNEPLGSIKCREFLDQLEEGQHLKMDSAAQSKYVCV